jgi:hypothetical protein
MRNGLDNQWRSQLKAHIRTLRLFIYGEDDSKTTFEHAQWTALAFAGMSYADIARSDLAKAPHLDPESTVRKAVTLRENRPDTAAKATGRNVVTFVVTLRQKTGQNGIFPRICGNDRSTRGSQFISCFQ